MKKKLLIILLSLLMLNKSYSQLFTFNFSGTGTCPTQNNSQLQIFNAAVSPLVRYGNGLSCTNANDAFNSTGWTSGTTIDANQYIEFSITVNPNYTMKLTQISFSVLRSSSGPANGRIAHDGGTGTFANSNDFSVTTNSNILNWDFPDFNSLSGGAVKFRLYGWNGSASGTMRFSGISLSGTVVASPLIIDNATGNVGIATTAPPSQKLEVNGNILLTNGRLMLGGIGKTIDTASMRTNNYLLGVNGTAIVNKLVVKKSSTPWPDYVFSKKYKLISLDSLNQYIHQNNHLPEIASAESTTQTGIDVYGTQAILLKKIEELTLYIIEQDRKQKLQDSKIKHLTESLKNLQKQIATH